MTWITIDESSMNREKYQTVMISSSTPESANDVLRMRGKECLRMGLVRLPAEVGSVKFAAPQ